MRNWLRSWLGVPQEAPAVVDAESADVMYRDAALARLTMQLDQVDSIDAKGATIFTIGSTVLPITASLLTGDQGLVANCVGSQIALAVGAICYVLLVGFSVLAYRLADWDVRPELGQWRDLTAEYAPQELHRWLGDAYFEAYVSNAPQVDRKVLLVGRALLCLAIEAVALTTAVLVPLFSN